MGMGEPENGGLHDPRQQKEKQDPALLPPPSGHLKVYSPTLRELIHIRGSRLGTEMEDLSVIFFFNCLTGFVRSLTRRAPDGCLDARRCSHPPQEGGVRVFQNVKRARARPRAP